jgi:Putative Actinobacterial Holin-X, holin superfamily III
VSDASGNGRGAGHREGGRREGGPQNIATAITDVSERFTVLIREEIELAKAEVAEKASKLARGAIVAVAAGIFLVTALFFVLIGLALLLYYVLPVGPFAYFWGFFAMALILIVLGAIAGLLAAKAVKRGAPPTPAMAIEEARKIRQSVSAPAPGAAADSHEALG